tara:strand:+ start:77 stop:337 length:261 start_codon:yes stop_codon:yes gene_type:complete
MNKMDYDKMTIEILAHDCFKRSGYAINKQDLISRIEFLCEQYHQSKVNNVVLDAVINSVCTACSGSGRYCEYPCSACEGTGKETDL